LADAHSRGTYGMPRIRAELRERGIHAGHTRIGRLMQLAGISGTGLMHSWLIPLDVPSARSLTAMSP